MKSFVSCISLCIALTVGCSKDKPAPDKTPQATQPDKPVAPDKPDHAARAKQLAKRFIIADGHIDLPYRLRGILKREGKLTENPAESTKGDFDYPRAKAGGLDAPFMSIYVPAEFQEKGGAKTVADEIIDMVEGLIKDAPDKFAAARSVADVKANFAAGKISLPLGIENGAAIEGKLENLAHFHGRGVRYITLTHSKDNAICDSSYDKSRTYNGLSDLGKQVVAEMNRLGMMIDVSHVSDDAFHQIIELTKVPVIASHSSVRHFVPGFERNMSDDMIKKLAKNGGVILINFGSGFLTKEAREAGKARREAVKKYREEHKIEFGDPRFRAFIQEYSKQNPPVLADITAVADHIDHVVKLVGVDHVGFGSDFDGVGPTLPTELKDASMYPNLIRVLLDRGYSDEDIEKMCSKNLFRVWQAVEDYAAKQGEAP